MLSDMTTSPAVQVATENNINIISQDSDVATRTVEDAVPVQNNTSIESNLSVASAATSPPNLPNTSSISERRPRSLTSFLFEEISRKQFLKCYERWRLWLVLFIIMTVIAVAAISIATWLAVERSNSFKTKKEAMQVQREIVGSLLKQNVSNVTDYDAVTGSMQQIFNTFDDNNDGVWDLNEFAEHLFRQTVTDQVFKRMDLDNDSVLSFGEVTFAQSLRPSKFTEFVTAPMVSEHYGYRTETINGTMDDDERLILDEYAANLVFETYGASSKGYITKEAYYKHHAQSNFEFADVDGDGRITFDEFLDIAINVNAIQLLRNPVAINLFSQLFSGDETFAKTDELYEEYQRKTESLSMCPVCSDLDTDTRRRLGGSGIDAGAFYIECDIPSGVNCGSAFNDAYDCVREEMDFFLTIFHDSDLAKACIEAVYLCAGDPDWYECSTYCKCTCIEDYEPYFDFDYYYRRRLGGCGQSDCPEKDKCFAGDNTVWVMKGDSAQKVRINELQIGDYVASKSSDDGSIGWSKVYIIEEKKDASRIPHLRVCYGEEEDECITLTHDHLLYVDAMEDESMKRADEVEIGSTLFVMDQAQMRFVERKVVYIGYRMENSTFVVHTMDANVVVSNVLASAYTHSYQRAKQWHQMAAIGRFISQYVSEKLAFYLGYFHYHYVFQKLDEYNLAFVVYNWYTAPMIVIATIIAPMIAPIWIVRKFV